MGQLRGLRGKVPGHAFVEPALDLGGQIKDLDSHGKVLFKPWAGERTQVTP
jgi:hypothetical protein